MRQERAINCLKISTRSQESKTQHGFFFDVLGGVYMLQEDKAESAKRHLNAVSVMTV